MLLITLPVESKRKVKFIAFWLVSCGLLSPLPFPSAHNAHRTANCGVEGLFDYTGWGVWTSVALVRVYRSWKILVRHTVDMWPRWGQVALISLPWL